MITVLCFYHSRVTICPMFLNRYLQETGEPGAVTLAAHKQVEVERPPGTPTTKGGV